MHQITVGCDPEFFVQGLKFVDSKDFLSDREFNAALEESYRGVVTPICGLLGGTKAEPKAFGKVAGFAHQEDGAAAEFNVPPAKTPREFMEYVSHAIQFLANTLVEKGLAVSKINNLELPPEWTAKHPNLLQIGCDPDYIAYESDNGVPIARVATPDAVGLVRGAGGHVHVGYPLDLCPPSIMAQLMDLCIALPSVSHDKQGKRRAWWGKAGLYRPKPYGIEYRTLSNWWIWSGSSARSIASRAFALVDSVQKNMIAWQALHNAMNWTALRDVIYREDANAAVTLYKRTCELFPVYNNCMQDAANRSVANE